MWTDTVPILTADDISSSVVGGSKPLALWFLDLFKNSEAYEHTIHTFTLVHHHTLNHTSPALSSRSNGRRAMLFNITMFLVGYTEGQSDYVSIQANKVKAKIDASQKL